MNIIYPIPWNSDKDLGKHYNWVMSLLPGDDDFACFIDGDACVTTQYYGKQIEDIIAKYPECGCFTAMTNRVGCSWQIMPGVPWSNNDMKFHRELGQVVATQDYLMIEDVSNVDPINVLSGVLILIRKAVWKKIGGFVEKQLLSVDNNLHWALMDKKEKLYLMKGVYLYHWYRGGDIGDNKHLKL